MAEAPIRAVARRLVLAGGVAGRIAIDVAWIADAADAGQVCTTGTDAGGAG